MSGNNFNDKAGPQIPRGWATTTNYTTGPETGNPTKVDPTDGAAAEGFVPEQPAKAQHFNFEMNAGRERLRDLTENALRNTRFVFQILATDFDRVTGICQVYNGETYIVGRTPTLGALITLKNSGLGGSSSNGTLLDFEMDVFLGPAVLNDLVVDIASAHPPPTGQNLGVNMVTFTQAGGNNWIDQVQSARNIPNSETNKPRKIVYDNFNDRFIVTSDAATWWTRASNGGAFSAEFTLPGSAGEDITMVAHDNLGTVVVGEQDTGVGWFSTNGGTSFTKMTTGFQSGTQELRYDPVRKLWIAKVQQVTGAPSRGNTAIYTNSSSVPDGGWTKVFDTRTNGFGDTDGVAYTSITEIEPFGDAWVIGYKGREEVTEQVDQLVSPGVYYSLDAGVTWKHLTGFDQALTTLKLLFDGFNLWIVVDSVDDADAEVVKFYRSQAIPSDELTFLDSEM